MNITKYVNINIGSVNCRSLYKQSQQSTTDDFIAMLKNKKLNILLCQETNIPNHSFEEIINNMEIKFKYYQAIWTEHCSIINFNNAINLEKIKISTDGRMILSELTFVDNPTTPFYIMNIYAHSGHVQRQERNNLFKDIINILLSMPEILPHLIMAGDFNYIYNLDMHINIYNIFSTIARLIWLHHFNHVLNSVPFNSTVVSKKICSELYRMSNMNDL